MTPGLQVADALLAASRASLRASEHLLGLQTAGGFWASGPVPDASLESQWLLLQLWFYPPQGSEWNPPVQEKIERVAKLLLDRQLADGGLNIYPSGPSEVNVSVEAYAALKLAGVAENASPMLRLRERILALGGLQAAGSSVKINLSLFNLYPRDQAPTVPVEVVLLGDLVYQMSFWARTTLIPLSIVQALLAGSRPAPAGFTLQELFAPGTPPDGDSGRSFFSWDNLFVRLDQFSKGLERRGLPWLRKRAIAKAQSWLLQRSGQMGNLGSFYPPLLYSILALDLLGYAADAPERAPLQSRFDGLLGPDHGGLPCYERPVRDTGLTAFALAEAGTATPRALASATEWFLEKEIRRRGDWSVTRPKAEPGGWSFSSTDEFYPGIDDTATVLLALAHSRNAGLPGVEAAAGRAVAWLLAMQSKSGGWAAFDADSGRESLRDLAFADRTAMLDSACPDSTGRVLEALARWNVAPGEPVIQRGIECLLKLQEADGSWYGRWGVNYIYGTCLALRGLRAAGYDDHEAAVLRAGEWLRSVQNADGGWGELCASYDRKSFVPGPSTPSQTAWAVLGLLAGGDTTSESVYNGIEHLISTQRDDGGWSEELATGTELPCVSYFSSPFCRNVYPVLALAEFRKVKTPVTSSASGAAMEVRR